MEDQATALKEEEQKLHVLSIIDNAMIILDKITRCNNLVSKLWKLTDKVVVMFAIPVCATTSKEQFLIHNSMHQRYREIITMTKCRVYTIPRGNIVCSLMERIILIRINMVGSPCCSCKNQQQCQRQRSMTLCSKSMHSNRTCW